MNFHLEPGQNSGYGVRVLVVEDHADVRRTLRALLDALGYDAVFAADMQSALQLAEDVRFDVLLSDIGLPDGDGWELLRRLKISGASPSWTVAMSCLNSPADVAQSEAAGYRVHLGKPFTARELESAMAVPIPAPTGE